MTTDDFDARDQLARLQLIRSANIGPVTYFQLIARFGSAQAALQAIPDLAARGGGRPPRLASLGDIEREVDRVRTLGARYLFLGQRDYPALLAELLRRGWTDEEVKKLAGGNVLRVMRETEKVAQRLRKERGPSDALIEQMDGEKK